MKIGYFENNVDLRYQDEVQGDLITQVNQTLEVLKAKYLRAWITYEGIQRLETWPIPMPALREAVLDAVAHKDYASGTPIQISVYPDKLMIWNPGELPPDWTVEKLLGKHASIPYNPDVANVFFRAGLIEAWGRGIERILEACRQAGAPEPEARYESTGLWVVFPYLPEHSMPVTGEVSGRTPVKTPVETGETPVETGETPVETPVKTPEWLIGLLRGNPSMTLAEVAKEIGKSQRAVERAAAKLVREGRLRYIGPRKKGRWEILE